MNRKIELLTFLYIKDAVHQSKNITKILEDLGYTEYEPTRFFLKHLSSEGYIEWLDIRPTYRNSVGEIVTKMDGEPNYEARITTKGIELIEERKIKLDSVRIAKRANRISFGSLFIALVAAGFSIYQWGSAETTSNDTKDKTKHSSAIQHKKDSTVIRPAPERPPLGKRGQRNHARQQK